MAGKYFFARNKGDMDFSVGYMGESYFMAAGKSAVREGNNYEEQFDEKDAAIFMSCVPPEVRKFVDIHRTQTDIPPEEIQHVVRPEEVHAVDNAEGKDHPDSEPDMGWEWPQVIAYFKTNDKELYAKYRLKKHFAASVLVEAWLQKHNPDKFEAIKRHAMTAGIPRL